MALFLSLIAAAAAQAAPQNLCQPAGVIHARLQVCQENEQFAAWADRCLATFRSFVKATSKAMQPGLARDAGETQLLKLADTLGDYGQTIGSLQNLIAMNRRAEQEMNAYLQSLVMPFDVRDLMNVPCIGDNVDQIRADLAQLREDRANLDGTLATAEKNYSSALAASDHLTAKGSPTSAQVAKGRGLSATGRAPVRPGTGPSDITGTKEAEARGKSF